MLQSPSDFLAGFIPPEVRKNPKYKSTIDHNLASLKSADFLSDSQKIGTLYQRSLSEDAGAAQANKIHGIQNICTVFQGIGAETNNNNLIKGAQLISTGTQLYSAYTAYSAVMAANTAAAAAGATISTAASFGSMLGPIGMAATTLFALYSAYKKRKDKSGNFPAAMMQAFSVLSEQVSTVDTHVLEGFENTYQYHRLTLDLVRDGFRENAESHHALRNHVSNVHVGLSNEIKKLLHYIQSLGDTLVTGQETISLQKFSGLVERARNISDGNIKNSPDIIQKTAYKFAEWSKLGGTASNPFYTGIKFVSKVRSKPSELSELYAVINKMINPINPYNIIEFQGLLAYLTKEHLHGGTPQSVDVDALFNPDFWVQATYRYVELREAHPDLVLDAGSKTLTEIIKAANNQLAWEMEKRHSKELYLAVFTLYEKGISQVKRMLNDQIKLKNHALNKAFTDKYPEASSIEMDLTLSGDELLSKFINYPLINPVCSGENTVSVVAPEMFYNALYLYCTTNQGAGLIPVHAWPTYSIVDELGYRWESKNQKMYIFPKPIQFPSFGLAERLGLLSISAHQKIAHKHPKESPGELLRLHFQNKGNDYPHHSVHSYEIDELYTLKATTADTEYVIQEHQYLRNIITDTVLFINTNLDQNIVNAQSKVSEMIKTFVKNHKHSPIRFIMTDSNLKQEFQDNALASIDVAIRLLSALLCHWPDEIKNRLQAALHSAGHIVHYLNDEKLYDKNWQDILDGIVSPQYEAFKTQLLNATQNPDNYWTDDEYTTAIKELSANAIDMRAHPPVATASSAALPAVLPSSDISMLTARISSLEQMMQVLIQQNALLMQEVKKNSSANTSSPSLVAYSPSSSSSNTDQNRTLTQNKID